eukprot:3386101-Amphidinium_carterae.1
MGTEYMKDLSHLGAMAQYGDEVNAEQMEVEPIYTLDFGNHFYAEAPSLKGIKVTRSGPKYSTTSNILVSSPTS